MRCSLGSDPRRRRDSPRQRAPRERAFAAAIEAFYADTTLDARTKAFADSLSALARRDTTDLEASAFAAVANLMYAAQLDVQLARAQCDERQRAIAFAERVYRASPRHPGAAHYLIHASDALNAYTPRALATGVRLRLHRAGRRARAAHAGARVSESSDCGTTWSHRTSAPGAASVAEAAHDHRPPTQLDYHDFAWLQYAYLEEGRWHAARAMIDSARRMIAPYDSGATFTVDAHYAPALLAFGYANETGRWTDGPHDASRRPCSARPAERQRERDQMAATNWERIASALDARRHERDLRDARLSLIRHSTAGARGARRRAARRSRGSARAGGGARRPATRLRRGRAAAASRGGRAARGPAAVDGRAPPRRRPHMSVL